MRRKNKTEIRKGETINLAINWLRVEKDIGTTGYRINFEEVQAGRVRDPILQSNDIIVVPQNGSKAAFDETQKTIRTFLGFLPFL